MNSVLGVAIYVIFWWLVFFMVLPVGVRTQEETGQIEPGTPPSAPARPHLLRKAVATTLISGILFSGFYAIVTYELITLDDIPFLPRFETHGGPAN